jgi:hypothetical protein
MSATPTPASYSVWNPPDAGFPIRYSLTLFREIDFFVGEGYRRIPHGGLEVGAVLYGHDEPAELTILAFRPIESQHSFGPSFTLSEFDREQLGKHVATPLIMEAGEELEVVGWLISKCRSDLVITEQESRIYDEYFPGPRQVTLLAKPEKFRPTRYGFLARPGRGGLLERSCRDSFILPLSTKGDSTAVRETLAETPIFPTQVAFPAPEVQPLSSVSPPPVPLLPRQMTRTPESPEPSVLASVAEVTPTPSPASGLRLYMPSEPARSVPESDVKHAMPVPHPSTPLEEELKVPPPGAPPAPVLEEEVEPFSAQATDSPDPPVSAPPVDSRSQPVSTAGTAANLPGEAIESVNRSARERTGEPSPQSLSPARGSFLMLQPQPPMAVILPDGPIKRLQERQQSRSASSWRETALGVAILVALAGAALWTYLRLPAPPIPLNAEIQPGQVVVTWPPELTKNADRCAITTWVNGQASSQVLSPAEQSEGKAVIQTTSPDVTVQLNALGWYRERGGQIRVFRIIPPQPVRRSSGVPQSRRPIPPLVGTPADPVPQPHPR